MNFDVVTQKTEMEEDETKSDFEERSVYQYRRLAEEVEKVPTFMSISSGFLDTFSRLSKKILSLRVTCEDTCRS